MDERLTAAQEVEINDILDRFGPRPDDADLKGMFIALVHTVVEQRDPSMDVLNALRLLAAAAAALGVVDIIVPVPGSVQLVVADVR